MAITISREVSVFGNKRVSIISCVAGSTSGNVDTGLGSVDAFTLGIVSMTSQGVIGRKNVGSAATSRPGIINLNSFTIGDEFFLVAYGK